MFAWIDRQIATTVGVAALLATAPAWADVLVTRDGVTVQGKVIREDADYVHISSEYGELRFKKVDLKSIQKDGVAASAPAEPTPGAMPAFDVFSSTPAPTPAAAPATSAFGGFGIPVGSPSSGDTFSATYSQDDFFSTKGAPTPLPSPTPAPEKARFKYAKRAAPPEVPAGLQAVIFGMGEEGPGWLRKGRSDWQMIGDDTGVPLPFEIQSRDNPTLRFLLREAKGEFRLAHQSQVQVSAANPKELSIRLTSPRGALWVNTPLDSGAKLIFSTPELTATTTGGMLMIDRAISSSRLTVAQGEVTVVLGATGVTGTVRSGESLIASTTGQLLTIGPPTFDLRGPLSEDPTTGDDAWNETPLDQLLPSESLATETKHLEETWNIVKVNKAAEGQLGGDAEGKSKKESGLDEGTYMSELEGYAASFLKYAEHTGKIPETAEGWSVLKFNPGVEGWQGPYIDGPIPPLDPWRQPLQYRRLTSSSGNPFGRVYSIWHDGVDQGGENASMDKVAFVMYFGLDRFRPKK